MPDAVDPILAERLARHGFIHRLARTVAEAARLTTAIQAQEPRGAASVTVDMFVT
jgi:hypothetical protein